MSKIAIGTAAGRKVSIDVDVLLKTRLLVQANSGKGKSWLLRRLTEQLVGKAQVIICDPEGEFATLREKFDFVLVGKGRDVPADTRSAALLAHKLLECRANAVCDLYEMKPSERHEWMRLFIEALIDAPKNLWHPVVVVVDEAHVFCPEKGAGESVASEALISLATRGRKRGFACVFATQRLGKLRKDAAAELLNIMVGGTFIDIDRKRAADALGFYGTEQREFFDQIKLLERGTFYALGPAISNERILVKVGDVETTHPEAGSAKHAAEPPPAPEKIKAMLAKLADLPKTAEEKAKNEAELRKEIRELKTQLRTQPVAKIPTPVLDTKAIERAVREAIQPYQKQHLWIKATITRLQQFSKDILNEADGLTRRMAEQPEPATISTHGILHHKTDPKDGAWKGLDRKPAKFQAYPMPVVKEMPAFSIVDPNAPKLKAGAVKMLQVLAQWHPDAKTRDELGALSGFSPGGGTFREYMGALARAGYIKENGRGVEITEQGIAGAGKIPDRPDSTDELVRLWKSKFKTGVGKMLDVLIAEQGNRISRQELGERSGFAASGGTFREYLGCLHRASLVEEEEGHIRAAKSFFEF